ncbi:MAG TPA: SGNH/GDSL hydrolase family protein [Planctomycetota bacterium]|nr:SGNH/GDSL hydrolase family protein [Planctomycetota bacterium]
MTLRGLLPRLLLSLALLAALLAVLEAVLCATGVLDSPSEFRFRRISPAIAEDRAGRYRLHPARFWTLAPHFRHSPAHLGRDATGEWPFRGRQPEPSPPGLLHVAVIGDSVVYGSSLDAADLPASCIADSLVDLGWTPDRVAVFGLGVPGYSTVQLWSLHDEALLTLQPAAVVLWPAAWNDQAPAFIAPDAEMLAGLAGQSWLGWLRDQSRLANALLRPGDEASEAAVIEGWKRGAPPCGWRVPAAEVATNLDRMLAACARWGVPAVLVASAHPPQTAARHPRTRQDAETVLSVARASQVPAVDAQAVLEAAGADAARSFVDYLHPSGEANALVGAAVAEALRPLLEARAASFALARVAAAPLSIVDVQPRRVPVLGDTTLRITLAGWSRDEPLPAVTVGGAPLIDTRAAGEHVIEGTLMANAPGLRALVVQSATGCAWLPDAVEYREPAIALETPPGEPARLTVAARPGDSVHLLVAAGRAPAPRWSPRGAYWLDASARALPRNRVADAQGLAAWAVDQLPLRTILVQALITPAGEAPDAGLGARWTSVVELTAPTSPAVPPVSSPGPR